MSDRAGQSDDEDEDDEEEEEEEEMEEGTIEPRSEDMEEGTIEPRSPAQPSAGQGTYTVALNFYLPSSRVNDFFWDHTTDGFRLMVLHARKKTHTHTHIYTHTHTHIRAYTHTHTHTLTHTHLLSSMRCSSRPPRVLLPRRDDTHINNA